MISLKRSTSTRGFWLLERKNAYGVVERTVLLEEGDVQELLAQGLVLLDRPALASVFVAALDRAKKEAPFLG